MSFIIGFAQDEYLVTAYTRMAVGHMTGSFPAHVKFLIAQVQQYKIITETMHFMKCDGHG